MPNPPRVSWSGNDAKAKARIAARLFPFFTFQVALKPRGQPDFTLTTLPT